MSDDETGPIESDAPVPPPVVTTPAEPSGPAQPAYAMPLPAGFPAYAVPRPRFADQVMGMRAVVATALACLVVGGLVGFALGWATHDDGSGGFGRGPGFFQQRGGFPNSQNGFPQGPGGYPHGMNGIPQQRLEPSQRPSQPPSQQATPNGG